MILGGELRDVNGDDNQVTGTFADDLLNTDSGIGLFASLDRLSVVTLKNNNATPTVATDDKSYMGLELSDLTAKLVGIEGLTFGVYDAVVKVNQAKDTDGNASTNPAKLDFTTFFDNTTGLTPASRPDVDSSVDTEIQGSVTSEALTALIPTLSLNLQ